MVLSALVVSNLSKKSYFSERILFLFILVNTSDFIYYNHYLLMELKYLFAFIFFYLNIATIKTLCKQGEICPNGTGFCIQSKCVCIYGFTTFYDYTINNPIYCNYRQTNRFIPLLLEFFFLQLDYFT